eukprot:gnl/Spiro4/2681_TR1294_c0_g1_i1.p1 gnl/Spiro4/2681_TR1294_c0_g1~~gnl/Spiro4/2681_TR1294_c0_g1_i1.p1  ORF type:complete len:296 (+),score=93.06 gnl/Spiro4/2681_TR1294_c0_g1_i1:59-889(+)
MASTTWFNLDKLPQRGRVRVLRTPSVTPSTMVFLPPRPRPNRQVYVRGLGITDASRNALEPSHTSGVPALPFEKHRHPMLPRCKLDLNKEFYRAQSYLACAVDNPDCVYQNPWWEEERKWISDAQEYPTANQVAIAHLGRHLSVPPKFRSAASTQDKVDEAVRATYSGLGSQINSWSQRSRQSQRSPPPPLKVLPFDPPLPPPFCETRREVCSCFRCFKPLVPRERGENNRSHSQSRSDEACGAAPPPYIADPYPRSYPHAHTHAELAYHSLDKIR